MSKAPFPPLQRFRVAMILFITGLVLSGLTAFPLLHELDLLVHLLGLEQGQAASGSLAEWVLTVRAGLGRTYEAYPWMAYGTDWLAFAHLVIALFFIGAVRDPLSSRSNLVAGMVACAGVLPLAFIAGGVRGIPFAWRLIDCSFGVIGFLLLLYCWRLLPLIEASEHDEALQLPQ